MNDQTLVSAVASSVLGSIRTGETAVLRRTAPAHPKREWTSVIAGPALGAVQGTGLSFAGMCPRLGATDPVMAADQVQGTAVRIPAAAVTGIPPRRTPSRC